mmetsp:Transcript_48928/g.87942  ORF Transcript_48928/g.87942 Transcript_48928/m.87942 type:complete len:93 (-) Transcript_48928:97-375(-)
MGQTCLESKGQLSVISRSGGPLDEFQRVAPRKPDANYFCLASVGCVVLILWLETRNLVKGRRKMFRRSPGTDSGTFSHCSRECSTRRELQCC